MSEEKNIQIFFVGALITSVVGAILLFADDFAGWWEGGSNYYYVHTGAQFAGPTPFFIILMAVALLLTGVYSVWSLKEPSAIAENQLKLVLLINVGVCTVSALMAIILLIWFSTSTIIYDWWLAGSFYGSLIGGILTALFLKLALDNLKR